MRNARRIVRALMSGCLVLALSGSLPPFAGFASASEDEGSMKAVAAQVAPALAGPKEKLSYALGMSLGKQFRDQSIEVDPDAYLQGLKDALSGGKTLLTEPEARSAVYALQREIKRKKDAQQAAGAPAGIAVSFKLDPQLTKGMYMGDRWVSPPTFTSRAPKGNEITVEARVEGRDAKGRTMKIKPVWKPSDPGMVAVTPGEGSDVKIAVKRAGMSTLKVAAPGVSKELSIKATEEGNAIRVEITQ